MPRLNLSSNEDFVPFLKYNAKAGRFYARPDGGDKEVEIINPRFVVDFENIKTGWIFFPEAGQGAPQKVWDANIVEMAAKPGEKFRRGFQVNVVGNDKLPQLGGGTLGLREWCANANNANTAISKMFEAWETGAQEHPGQVPFFACKQVIPVTGQYGTNYEPDFVLVTWIDRAKVAALNEAAPAPAPAPAPRPATSREYHAPLPPPSDFPGDPNYQADPADEIPF